MNGYQMAIQCFQNDSYNFEKPLINLMAPDHKEESATKFTSVG